MGALQRRKRLPDGSFGELEKVFEGFTSDEQITELGYQLAQEKLKNMQKDMLLSSLGQQVSLVKIELMQLRGGES